MKKIMVVEDDKALCNGICLALKSEELFFLPCGTIREARETVGQNVCDLIILDIHLPDGNGMDFLKEIREASSVPVILLTANDMETDIVAGLESGADDYVTNPLEFCKGTVELELSKTEQKLLKALVQNPGVTIERATLVDRIWTDGAEYVDENALSVTVRRLRGKLEKDPSRPQYIKTVYGLGYVWAVDEK